MTGAFHSVFSSSSSSTQWPVFCSTISSLCLVVSLSQVPIVKDELNGKTGTWKGTERQLTATATFIYVCERFIIFPGSVHIFGCSKIDTPILEIGTSQIYECRNWETEHYNSVLEITRLHSTQFHFWEYINQTFILDYRRPFMCSAWLKTFSAFSSSRRLSAYL